MDEMGKNIRLYSEEVGFKFLLFSLSVWTLLECYLAFTNEAEINVVPTLLLAGALVIEDFCEIFMKRKMISDDDEYKEPNKVLFTFILFIAVVAIIVSIDFFITHI